MLETSSRRSPHGERGLKYVEEVLPGDTFSSLPSRGAWIEIQAVSLLRRRVLVAPLTGSVD